MSEDMSEGRPSDKDIAGVFRCIDRYSRTPDDFDFYRISSKELKKAAYSGKYKPVVEWLVSEGFIEVDDFYISGSRSKGYRPIRRPDVTFNAPDDEPAPAYSDELCEAVAANLKLFTHAGDWAFDSAKDQHRQERDAANWDSEFRGNVTRKNGGRMSSMLTTIVSGLRPQLLIDGESPSIVDISSAQPWMMANLTDDPALLCDVLAGNFYSQFPLGKPPKKNGQRLSKKEWQKQAYGRVFLGPKFMTDNPVAKTREHVAAKYPKAWKWSVDLRKKGDSPAALLQAEEARFVLDHVLKRLTDEDMTCAPIHDAIMCKASEADYVQGVFKEEAQKLYGTAILTHIE
jgi:hypothetical protein